MKDSAYIGTVAITFIAMFFEGSSSALFAASKENFMSIYGIGLNEFGMLLTIRSIASGILPIVGGSLSDKIGRKKVILMGAFSFLLFYIIVPNNTSFAVLLIMACLFGASHALMDPASQSILFDALHDATPLMPFIQVAFASGSFFAPFLVSVVMEKNLNWKISYYVHVVLIILIIIYVATRKFPEISKEKEEGKKIKFKNPPKLKVHGAVLGVLVFFTSIVGSVLGNWVDIYMKTVFNFSEVYAVRVISFYQLGAILGALLSYFLVKKVEAVDLLMKYLLIILIAVFIGIMAKNPIIFIISIVIAGAFIGTMFSLSVGISGNYFPDKAGTATGLLSSLSSLGIALSSLCVGRFVDIIGIRKIYFIVLGVILIAFIISLIIKKQNNSLIYREENNG